jgi:hypothetical protein
MNNIRQSFDRHGGMGGSLGGSPGMGGFPGMG